jgi:glycerate dehydrogenase
MKNSAFIINTSRGGTIDETALAEALHNGIIAGAGIDVLDGEPMRADHPFFDAPNCIITPHIAWASIEARQRLVNIVFDNLKGYLDGKPLNNVAKKS